MERRPVTFFSDGLRLDGELHLPTGLEPGDRRPAVITCSGYQGLKAIHPARFARALINAQIILVFAIVADAVKICHAFTERRPTVFDAGFDRFDNAGLQNLYLRRR